MLEEISDLSHACLSLSLLPTCEPMLSLVLAYIGLALHVQCCLLGLYHVSSNLLALVVSANVNASFILHQERFLISKMHLAWLKRGRWKVRPYRLVIASLT